MPANLPRMDTPQKQVILVHGRGFKPPKADFERLWKDALEIGFGRDRPDLLPALKAADVRVAYYADLSADWLAKIGRKPKPGDMDRRRTTLGQLAELKASQFTRNHYARMRGSAPVFEAIADFVDYPLSLLRLSERLFREYAPELAEYWADVHFGSDLRLRLTDTLRKAMKREGPVCLVGHSLGSMICYDVLWKLSHYGEYRREPWNRPVDLLLTLGSPVADETIRRHLKGQNAPEEFRHPTNVRRWVNIAAEDDIIAHDQTVADDFAAMRRAGCQITDHRIYNLALRNGRPNPHEGTGYLVHPKTVRVLAKFLDA